MLSRPQPLQILAEYDHIFHSGPFSSISKLQNAAIGGRLFSNIGDEGYLVSGRSIAWKLFLIPTNPLATADQRPNVEGLLRYIFEKREGYAESLKEIRHLEGSYEQGLPIPDKEPISIPQTDGDGMVLEKNNPLSLDAENPWKQYFASLELRRIIQQDVERTFPDISYFQEPSVQHELTAILFLYSGKNPKIGYRQGMHELLACIYQALDYDSLEYGDMPEASVNNFDTQSGHSTVVQFCDRSYISADAFMLFALFMSSALSEWYEWREPAGQVVLQGPLDTTPYVAPIVHACNFIQNDSLRRVDPVLYESLKSNGVEPQIFGIRWLRLLFTREFTMQESMLLWDGLLAADPSLELCQWISVAMLMRIRNKLIPGDYSIQLMNLLRYPAISSLLSSPSDFEQDSSQLQVETHHISLLIRQALMLREKPNAITGASVVYENRNVLNISTEVPNALPSRSNVKHTGKARTMSVSETRGGSLPEFIAKGLMERGESLGINRTVLNTISEIRRNLPDISHTLTRTPSFSDGMSDLSGISLNGSRSPEIRPPWEPRTRFNIEREIVEIRDTLKTLSAAVGAALDVLLQSEDDTDKRKTEKDRRREALECLDYAREIMGRGGTGEIDEERLFGEVELNRRREEAKKLEEIKAKETEKRANEKSEQERKIKEGVIAPSKTATIGRVPVNTASSDGPHTHGTTLKPTIVAERSTSTTEHAASSKERVTVLPDMHPSQSSSKTTSPKVHASAPPWLHTRSSFSSPVNSSAYSLPRLPPPTSITALSASRSSFGRRRTAFPQVNMHGVSDDTSESTGKDSNGTPGDPLGAIK